MKFKKGDTVLIKIGKDNGRKGKIEQVFKKKNTVLIGGLNVYKRHVKKQGEGKPSGIIDFPRPIPISRVSLVCPKCQKVTRIGFVLTQKEKHRICKKCKQLI